MWKIQKIKCESCSSRFQPGEGPTSRGLLRGYEPSCGPSFQAVEEVRPPLFSLSDTDVVCRCWLSRSSSDLFQSLEN